MKTIKTEDLKGIQLDILNDIHQYCIANNIRYSIAYGTLLGAVRHKGYIPWDDDIDIMMPREDYERFIKTYGNSIYRIADLSNNPEYGLPFAKVEDYRTIMDEYVEGKTVYGVYVDVFPVDNVPDNIFKRKYFYWKVSCWGVLYNLKTVKTQKGRNIIKNIMLVASHLVLHFVSKRYIAYKISEMATTYVHNDTDYMGVVAVPDVYIDYVPSRFFDDYVELPFETLIVKAIKAYDKDLKAAYGDYMQLPPVEKRVSHHVFNAYWK